MILMFLTGFGRFDFFAVGVLSFGVQYFADRAMITYWYDPKPILSDPTNESTVAILKFIPGVFLI